MPITKKHWLEIGKTTEKQAKKLGTRLNHKNNCRVPVSYTDTTKSKFAKFFVSKEEFVEKLMEKFEAMGELIK